MGLDIVEYVLRVEDLFDVTLPESELREVRTPRDLARVVQRSLPTRALRSGCLSQRAFYRLRKALLEVHPNLPRAELRPSTECYSLRTGGDETIHWGGVATKVGIRICDRFAAPSRVRDWLGFTPETLGSLAERVVAERPSTLVNANEGWTDSQIIEILLRVVEHDQGLEPHRHRADSKFVDDMGID